MPDPAVATLTVKITDLEPFRYLMAACAAWREWFDERDVPPNEIEADLLNAIDGLADAQASWPPERVLPDPEA